MAAPSTSLTSRLADSLRTPNGKIAAVALVSGVFTAGSILVAQTLRRKTRRRRLKSAIQETLEEETDDEDELVDFTRPVGSRRSSMAGVSQKAARQATENARAGGKGKKKTSEVIIREALARNYVFLGEDKMDQVRKKFVVVVGLGGVGSAAAVMLVRSGIRKIRIIDFDQVSLSSLNVRAGSLSCP